jgi:transposase
MIVMESRYALRDEQWERLKALGLPGQEGHVGVTAKDNRLFVEAVLYRLRAGLPWRALPEHFGNTATDRGLRWHRVYVRFNRWSKQGVWQKVFAQKVFAQKVFAQLAKEPNNEYAMIDSTIVRAHRSAAGARKRGAQPAPATSESAWVGAGEG